jgi:hypothetical protein
MPFEAGGRALDCVDRVDNVDSVDIVYEVSGHLIVYDFGRHSARAVIACGRELPGYYRGKGPELLSFYVSWIGLGSISFVYSVYRGDLGVV